MTGDEIKTEDLKAVEELDEKPKEEEPKKEQPKEQTSELLKDIKQEYERRLNELKTAKDNEIKQRDDIIKQLLRAEDTEKPLSFVDKINEKRNFKKW